MKTLMMCNREKCLNRGSGQKLLVISDWPHEHRTAIILHYKVVWERFENWGNKHFQTRIAKFIKAKLNNSDRLANIN